MRQINSKIYDKNYYLNICLGSEVYKESKGRKINKKWEDILSLVNIEQGTRILDLGCGRGDAAFYMARKGARVIGVDYSKDGIRLANESLKHMPSSIKEVVKFYRMDAKKFNFENNYFDKVVSFDLFEHLYNEELEIVMDNISKMLKKNGILLVHTEVNKIYLDFTHRVYVYPLSCLLVWFNKFLTGKDYPNLPKDPRNEFHKIQHVNEPTYFYLKNLFKRYKFEGRITSNIPYKSYLSWKDMIYNIIVWIYPFSSFWPFNLFFASDYICLMKNKK